MISCVVVFGGLITRVVYNDTQQCLLGTCVIFGLTAVVVLQNSIRN